MAAQQLLKIVYALKFWVRWCTCSMWRMLLPYYLLFLISIILFLKTDIRILYTFRTELARLVMGTILLVIIGERARHSQVCSIENRGYIYIYILYIIYSTCKFCSYNP